MMLHKKDYIYKILNTHDFGYISRYFIIVTFVNLIFRVAVRSVSLCRKSHISNWWKWEINLITDVYFLRIYNVSSNVRQFCTLYEFNAIQIKARIIGPLNLFDAILSRCISRHYCFDLGYETSSRSLSVEQLTWHGFAFGNRFIQRPVMQRRDWWP